MAGRILPFTAASLLVAAAAGAGLAIKAWIDPPNISMVFLAAVLISAVRFGLWPSLYASVLSTLAYNFLFLAPIYSLSIADPANIVALVFLLAVAVLTSDLAARLRSQVAETRQQAAVTEALHNFSHKLAEANSGDKLLWTVVHQLAAMLRVEALILLPPDGVLDIAAAYPPDASCSAADLAAAELAWRGERVAGGGAARYLFLPLRSPDDPLGVVGVARPDRAAQAFDDKEQRLLSALVDQAAVAIARLALAEREEALRVSAATEELRLALLSAISHDFRTPLAAIIGSSSSLRTLGEKFDRETRHDLLDSIREEAERLNRFVDNVLDMTRLESGALRPALIPVDLAEAIALSAADTAEHIGRHRLALSVESDLPLARLDPVLLRHVLGNLIDNAAKFSPDDTAIDITARRFEDGVVITVADQGPGVPPERMQAIFERFMRVPQDDRRRAGSGLGLAICKGFVEAMGGAITVQNRDGGTGAEFAILLPGELLLDAQPDEGTEP